MEELLSYTWPGNVRELQNAVERSVVMTRRELIHPEDLILQPNRKVRADRYASRSLERIGQYL